MKGYGDLSYFKELDFIEGLDCYVHLMKDIENELTIEKITMLLQLAFGGNSRRTDTSKVDALVNEYF